MSDRPLPLKELLELLPAMPEFDALRIALLNAASLDVEARWSGVSKYGTFDRRVVPSARVGRILMEAELAVRRRIKALYDAATIAFSSIAEIDHAQRAHQLVLLGEAAEAADAWRDAVAFYSLAESVSRKADDIATRIVTTRRLARAYLNTGLVHHAIHYYSISLADCAAAGDDNGQIVAATGLGNAAAWAGRWNDADRWYGRALEYCRDGNDEMRIELIINRAVVARERGDADTAEEWLAQSQRYWDQMSATSRAGWLNVRGMVHITRNQFLDAQAALEDALTHAAVELHQAMILDNLAEVAILRGDFEGALMRAREAEEHALRHGSPRALAEVYMRLGRACTLQNDANGVGFFEKAIDLIRDEQYPLLLGAVYQAYAALRTQLGDLDAAKSLLSGALAIFTELGAEERAGEAEALLRALPG